MRFSRSDALGRGDCNLGAIGRRQTLEGGKDFTLGVDTGPPGPHVVVLPDKGKDTVDPPIEYRLDLTAIVQAWLDGAANHGLAIAPVIDRAVDGGYQSRFQIYASEHPRVQYTPKLTVQLRP